MTGRARSEAGFTLVELMVAMIAGVIVIFGAFALLDTTTRVSASTADRVDTSARGRQAIDTITQELRSQICQGTGLPALIEATPDSLTFYASLAPEQTGPAGTTPPLAVQKRQLTYRPATKDILETVWKGTGVRPTVTFNTAPTSGVIATRIERTGTTPIFRYYRFQVPAGDTVARPTLIATTPLVAADLARTVQIDVNFTAVGAKSVIRADLSQSVFVRTSSPTNPNNSPLCL